MSRTLRRNKKHLIASSVGSREDNQRDCWWLMHRYPTLTFDQAYDRRRHRYTRDHHSGHFGVPRWYRRRHGSKKLRMREGHLLFLHDREDSWEAHSPDSRCRDAKWYWW